MPLYEYECPTGHVTERLRAIKHRETLQLCEVCGKETKLIISAPFFDPKMGIDGSMPTMADKWAQKHIKGAKE